MCIMHGVNSSRECCTYICAWLHVKDIRMASAPAATVVRIIVYWCTCDHVIMHYVRSVMILACCAYSQLRPRLPYIYSCMSTRIEDAHAWRRIRP